MEELVAKSPTLTVHDTKEGAYQYLEEVHGAHAADPEHGKNDHRVK